MVILSSDGCAYDGPTELGAGKIRIGLDNQTETRFDLDLWQLDAGHTYDEFVAHLEEETRRLEAGEPPLGHPSFATLVDEATATDASAELATTLVAGTFAFACIRFEGGQPTGFWPAGPLTAR